MDDKLENIAQSIFAGRVPQHWSALAPETRKCLGDWIKHLKVYAQIQFDNVF